MDKKQGQSQSLPGQKTISKEAKIYKYEDEQKRTIRVLNLGGEISDQLLKSYFVNALEINHPKMPQTSMPDMNIAYIKFDTVEESLASLVTMQHMVIKGRILELKLGTNDHWQSSPPVKSIPKPARKENQNIKSGPNVGKNVQNAQNAHNTQNINPKPGWSGKPRGIQPVSYQKKDQKNVQKTQNSKKKTSISTSIKEKPQSNQNKVQDSNSNSKIYPGRKITYPENSSRRTSKQAEKSKDPILKDQHQIFGVAKEKNKKEEPMPKPTMKDISDQVKTDFNFKERIRDKPENLGLNDDRRTLRVSNLGGIINDLELNAYFGKNVTITHPTLPGSIRENDDVALIQYENEEAAVASLATMRKVVIKGRNLNVKLGADEHRGPPPRPPPRNVRRKENFYQDPNPSKVSTTQTQKSKKANKS